MDQWDDLLEQAIASRMENLREETAQQTPAAPHQEPKEEAPAAEKPQTDSGAGEASPPAPAPHRPAGQQGGFTPLQPGEIRTVTIPIYAREQTPPKEQKPARSKGSKKQTKAKPPEKKPHRGQKIPPVEVVQGAEKKRNRSTSIQGRWLVNSMGAVSAIMVLIGALAVLLLSNYFYSTLRAGLENKAQTAADFFANYQTEQEYQERAASYVSNFGEADSIELEFLDTTGEIILSSYAYQQTSGVTPGTKDITQALETGALSTWTGKDPFTGERIMAVSAPVVQNETVKGVIRMVTSLQTVDRQMVLLTLLLLAGVAAILLMIYSTNLYFVKSIVQPIAAITETTKRIAAGSYGVQIEKRYNDEIGQLVDTINDMSLKVSQAEKVKSEFISSVSHELRTPLTAINGWGETLLRGEVTDRRDLQKGLAIIVSEAKRLTKMVEELLEFSRIEDGRFTLRIEQIDIKAELEDAVYTYREFFRKKGITLEYHDCEEEFPPIPGDPERLRQVFSNLLDNAAKHGGSGKRITVSILPDGEYVAIRIRDYGHGIPPEELPHVKTKFYKGSSKARGSGIGLAVCDEIAQRHNGSLDIANAYGGGCVVTLRLPLHEE